jgi:hypothetical protein
LTFISLPHLPLDWVGAPLACEIIQGAGIVRPFGALFQVSLGGVWLRQHRNLSQLGSQLEHAFGTDNASRHARRRCPEILLCERLSNAAASEPADRLSDPREPHLGRSDARCHLVQLALQLGLGPLALAVRSHDRVPMRAVPSRPLLSRPPQAAAQATPRVSGITWPPSPRVSTIFVAQREQ